MNAARTTATVAGVVAGLGAAAIAYGSLYERNAYRLLHVTIPVLPAGARPVTALHISDLHLAPWQVRRIRWVRSLAAFRPDLVIDTGDNYGHVDALPAIKDALEPFASLPAVFVDGSNDHFAPQPKNPARYLWGATSEETRNPARKQIDTRALHSLFASWGWHDLNNGSARMTINENTFDLVGTDDAHRFADALETVPASLAELGEKPSQTTVLGVTHAPYKAVLNALASNDAAVIFAGHTHGGQVCIPGVGALVSNCDLPPRQASGLSTWTFATHTSWLHVSNGVGTSIYAPIRFACPPSATLVSLLPVE